MLLKNFDSRLIFILTLILRYFVVLAIVLPKNFKLNENFYENSTL